MNYESIRPYYALLKDHPQNFVYYGKAKDEFYLTYDAQNDAGEYLQMSYECNELCEELAYVLQDDEVIDLDENSISDEQMEYLCAKASEKEVRSYVISIIDSLSYNDLFITYLNNGFFVKLIGYLLSFSKE